MGWGAAERMYYTMLEKFEGMCLMDSLKEFKKGVEDEDFIKMKFFSQEL